MFPDVRASQTDSCVANYKGQTDKPNQRMRDDALRTLVFCSVLRVVLFLSCFCSFAELSESFCSGCHFVPKRNSGNVIFSIPSLPLSSSPLLEKYKPVEPKCALRILVTSGCFLSPVFQLLARRLLWGATNTFIERHHHHMHYLNIAKGTTDPGVDCFDQ